MRLLIAATVPVTFESFLTPFARHFRALGWRVDGMAAGLSRSHAARDFDRTWDVRWSRNPLEISGLRELSRIRRIAVRERYDIVHVHTPVAAFLTRCALRQRPPGMRVVYTAHGFHFAPGLHPLRNAAFLSLEKLAGRWTDALVVMNAEDVAAVGRYRIVPPERLRVIHGIGLDVERFARARVSPDSIARLRSEMGLADGVPVVAMAAEFSANKRHGAVLEALARTRAPVHLALAGEGRLLEAARQHADLLGISDRVHFLGWREDVDTVLAASVATVLFSAHEGLPRCVMESLALEVPVVGADIRGVRDLVGEDCGILVPPGDVAALAAAIDAVVLDPARGRTLGRNGRKKMTGRFSLPSVILEHERLYDDLVAGSCRSAGAPSRMAR